VNYFWQPQAGFGQPQAGLQAGFGQQVGFGAQHFGLHGSSQHDEQAVKVRPTTATATNERRRRIPEPPGC
jgi:hypothetical protein